MTTFQDPPPQSRRAVRQSERGETPEQGSAQQPQPYSFDGGAPVAGTPSAPTPPHTGRRAQPVEPDGAPQPPLEDRQAPPPSQVSGGQQLSNQPAPDQPAYRVRDFSPEGRQSAPSRDQFQNVASAPPPSMPAPDLAPPTVPAAPGVPADLDYQTHGVLPVRSHSAAAPVSSDNGSNHTLTRRELRELRAAQEQQAPPLQMPESIDTLLNSGPIEIPTLAPAPGQSQALADAMAEFDQLTRARRQAEAEARDAQVASLATPLQPAAPAESTPAVSVQPFGFDTAPEQLLQQVPNDESAQGASDDAIAASAEAPTNVPEPLIEPAPPAPVQLTPEHLAPIQLTPTEPAPIQLSPPPSGPSVPQAPPAELNLGPEPVLPAPTWDAPSTPEAIVPSAPEAASIDPVFIEPTRTSSRPTGHWSVQAEQEDDEAENTITRTVGTGTSAITTSALVLPSVPQASDLDRPFGSTGEILVTGSIDLPHSLGSTGAHPHRIDNSDFEDDPLDSQVSAPDSAPVRAIRAVSTHTSTRGVIENKKPQDNRWLTRIIIAVASLLVVGVAGLVYVLVTHNL